MRACGLGGSPVGSPKPGSAPLAGARFAGVDGANQLLPAPYVINNASGKRYEREPRNQEFADGETGYLG
jgi:hypothetical protein